MKFPAPGTSSGSYLKWARFVLIFRLVWPTRRGGWPCVTLKQHMAAAAVWRQFLTSGQYFGRRRLYQSFEPLLLPGARSTSSRVEAYGFAQKLEPSFRVLDVGCNMGALTLAAARDVIEVVGIDTDASLLACAEIFATYSASTNVEFRECSFMDFTDEEGFDVVICAAVHQWVGVSFDAFVTQLRAVMKPNSLLLFESNNYDKIAQDFEDEVLVLLQNGFAAISDGQTRHGTLRKHYWLKFVGQNPTQ